MATDAVLRQIIERVDTEPAYFLGDEVARWPEGLLDGLTRQGLLKEAQRVLRVRCRGCERDCIMDVMIVPGQGKRRRRVLIACDKDVDIGLVPVDPERLRRWRTTITDLSAVVAGLLDIDDFQPARSASGCVTVGKLKGSKRHAVLTLATGSPTTLRVAGHSLPVSDVLYLKGNRIGIDRDVLTGLVDHPVSNASEKPYEPATTRREARKLDTRARHDARRKEARTLRAQHPGQSERWIAQRIAQRIAKLDRAHHAAWETIRKQIRVK